jgi:hypothetical protein
VVAPSCADCRRESRARDKAPSSPPRPLGHRSRARERSPASPFLVPSQRSAVGFPYPKAKPYGCMARFYVVQRQCPGLAEPEVVFATVDLDVAANAIANGDLNLEISERESSQIIRTLGALAITTMNRQRLPGPGG